MPKSDLGAHQHQLRVWADELARIIPKIPIDLSALCKQLGVMTRRNESVPRFKSYLSYGVASEGSAAILLPGPARPEDISIERLCAAHELGHYLLLREYNLTPKTNSAYWQYEDLCDDF